MKVTSAKEAKKLIGQVLYWEETSVRYWILRSGILTDVNGARLEFHDNGDYRLIRDFPKLDTEKFGQGAA